MFTGKTKTKGSAALQGLRDEHNTRMLKSRILDLVHTKRLLSEVSNALVSVLDKNNQLSDAEKIQLKNK